MDHLYTMSYAEKDNAINTLGYTDEAIAGWVMTPDSPRIKQLGIGYHFYTSWHPHPEVGESFEGVVGEGVAFWWHQDPLARDLYALVSRDTGNQLLTISAGSGTTCWQTKGT